MDKKLGDIEKDLRSLRVHEPSADFASKVVMQVVQQIESKPVLGFWMKWIPWFCMTGFTVIFLVFLFLIMQFLSTEMIDPKILLALQVIGASGMGIFLFLSMDRLLRDRILR